MRRRGTTDKAGPKSPDRTSLSAVKPPSVYETPGTSAVPHETPGYQEMHGFPGCRVKYATVQSFLTFVTVFAGTVHSNYTRVPPSYPATSRRQDWCVNDAAMVSGMKRFTHRLYPIHRTGKSSERLAVRLQERVTAACRAARQLAAFPRWEAWTGRA